MILRRYTPPTCTLEITAKSSLFSRWMSRSALEDLHFELHFDAPQLREEQQVKLRGDRAQLEALSDAVNSYVHKFLCQSAIALDVLGLTKKEEADNKATAKAEGEREDRRISEPAPQPPTILQPAAAAPPVVEVIGEIEDDNPAQLEPEPAAATNAAISEGIYLQPRGLLGHDLFLGTLATPESGAVVHLDVLQLFDLATAIELYEAEAEAPPARPNWFKQTPSWAKIAALVVLTLGTTVGAIELLNRNASVQKASQKAAPPPSPVAQQPVAIAPVPAPPPAVPPAPAPPAQQLTPLPVPTPTSRLPKLPKILEDSTVAAAPNLSQFPAQPNLQAPNVARLPSLPGAPAPQGTLPGAIAQMPAPNSAPAGASSSTTIVQIPPPPPTIIPQIPPPPNTQPPPISIPPESTADARAIDSPPPNPVAAQPRVEPESTPTEAPPEVVLKTPEPAPTQAAPTETAPTQGAAAVPRNAEPAPPLPRIEGLPDGAPEKQAANTPSPSPTPQPTPPQSKAPEAIAPATGDTPAPVEEARGSLLNEATQVVEARDYFQQRWQPQPDLTQPLEYTLSLNPDGSIQKFTPRGDASGKFVERTGMPLMNEKFVSPLQEGKALRIRVLLKPDGKVQAFEEPLKEGL